MVNTFIYLIGPPGVGKYTVASAISEKSGAQVIDNHYWNNVIFGLVEQDGVTPLPSAVWDNAWSICEVVLDSIAEFSPPQWNFVFTHAAVDEGDSRDRDFSKLLFGTAQRRNAELLTVNLRCSEEELFNRVTNPDRRSRMKDTNPDNAELANAQNFVPVGVDRHLIIDTTTLQPGAVADQILSEIEVH